MLRLHASVPLTGRAVRCSLYLVVAVSVCLLTLYFSPVASAQAKDPGPRTGAAGAGSYFPTLNTNEQLLFNQSFARFQEEIGRAHV